MPNEDFDKIDASESKGNQMGIGYFWRKVSRWLDPYCRRPFLQFRDSVSIKLLKFTFINFARLVLIAFAVFYVTIVGAMKLRTAFMQVETDYFE